jgi:LysM repeat protein
VPSDWRRYVAPAAFLLAVTIAVVLIRSGLESGGGHSTTPPPHSATTVAATTTTTQALTTTAKTVTKKFWTVKAGDTFGVIATSAGVSVATIQALNPTVSSTSLFIGEKIRIK